MNSWRNTGWLNLALALVVGLATWRFLVAEPVPTRCELSVELVDGATGEPLSGIIQARTSDGKLVTLDALVNRGQGIDSAGPIHDWWVLAHKSTLDLPAAALEFRALAGLETELAVKSVDLTGQASAALRIELVRFHKARAGGYLAGNTHLHLMKLSKRQADRYLREVPLADGLDIVFLSYLERAVADLEYTSNKYTPQELEGLRHDHVRFGHGQEHRHNFGSHGEGYGHILLLDIPYVIQPVSIGPGITRQGPDAPPLQQGIDKTRALGGKVIWAHNRYGFEDIPNWLTGRVHANNIYDGSDHGSYEDTYYRYLNVGLRVPFSTGTDWFIYDFSRVYAMADRAISPTEWLDLVAAGKTYITNGPLLEFTVNGRPLGSQIELAAPAEVMVRGRAIGRADFGRIELVHNGRVVHSAVSRRDAGHFVATLELDQSIDAPSWLAPRTPPRSSQGEPQAQLAANEYGGRPFAHTSPIYLALAGQGVFDSRTAVGMIDEMKKDMETIQAQAHFDDEAQRAAVLGVYREAIERLERRIGR